MSTRLTRVRLPPAPWKGRRVRRGLTDSYDDPVTAPGLGCGGAFLFARIPGKLGAMNYHAKRLAALGIAPGPAHPAPADGWRDDPYEGPNQCPGCHGTGVSKTNVEAIFVTCRYCRGRGHNSDWSPPGWA